MSRGEPSAFGRQPSAWGVAAAVVCFALGGAAPAAASPDVARTYVTIDRVDAATTATVRRWCGGAHGPLRLRVRRADAPEADARVVPDRPRTVRGAGRHVHAFPTTGLTPATTYAFVVESDDGPVHRGAFRTLPARGPVRFAVGGDVMPSSESLALAARVRSADVDLLVLGGDLAYDDGAIEAVPYVDAFVAFLAAATTHDDGRAIPVVAAVGNHEARVEMDLGRMPRGLHGAPFFDALFLDDDPARTTFRAVALSDVAALLLLDSGHVWPHDGAQAAFVRGALRLFARTPLKIAAYHVPLYPSVRALGDPQARAGRRAWEPIFVEEGLAVAFEHHDHALKRVGPLVDGRPRADGVVYLGDGGFGRPTRPLRRDLDARYGTALSATHVWLVVARADGLSARAIAPDGAVLDEAYVRPRTRAAPR